MNLWEIKLQIVGQIWKVSKWMPKFGGNTVTLRAAVLIFWHKDKQEKLKYTLLQVILPVGPSSTHCEIGYSKNR